MGKLRQFDPFVAPTKAMEPPAIVLCNPKFPHNLGSVVRAASCFNIGQVWLTGSRLAKKVREAKRIPREERMRDYREVSMILDDHPMAYAPDHIIPIAIELLPGATPLTVFDHPENAVYVFGPEDGSLPKPMRAACHARVFIPTKHCTNLSAAVYLVMYDRMLKRTQKGLDPVLPIDEVLARTRPSNGWHEPRRALDFIE